MNIKIVNKSKLIRGMLFIIIIVICSGIFIGNKSFSHSETMYKTIYVSHGDTLWSIAKEEKENNEYYENKDIRDIISNIKNINKLNSSYISTYQTLIIPYI